MSTKPNVVTTDSAPTDRLLVGPTNKAHDYNTSLGQTSMMEAMNQASFASNLSIKALTTDRTPNYTAPHTNGTAHTAATHPHMSHHQQHRYDEHRKSVDLETHGDEAITLVQSLTPAGKCWDISRLTFGSALLMLSVVSIIYAITEHRTLWPDTFPEFSLYIILFVDLFCLGILEGLQIAVVELAHEDPLHFKSFYPRAAKLLQWENTGRNVERFLIGRQVLVVLLVFVCARITTFDIWFVEVPDLVMSTIMFSGFLGVILVVTVAQLTPQVLAAAYPIEFLNLAGMNIAFGVCLCVESTGIAHAVWILCVTVKRSVYSCVCKYHALNKKGMMDLAHAKQRDMAAIAKDIEMSVDEASVSKSKRRSEAFDQEFTVNNSKVVCEIAQLMQTYDDRPDLFYLHGDGRYLGPSYYCSTFRECGLEVPSFLLPPSDKRHVPPHIVAMALLRKSANDSRRRRI